MKTTENILEEYTKGKKQTSESNVGKFTVRVYGELDVERLVRRLLKNKCIAG